MTQAEASSHTAGLRVLAVVVLALTVRWASAEGIPAPRDVAYPGTIRLEVDATDVAHRVFHVRESIPVGVPGPFVLLYPKWLPGNHSTTGPVELLAGLTIRANGARVDWRRDAEFMHAFHLTVPAGAHELDVQFDFVTPTEEGQGRRMIVPDLLRVHWEKNLLYPAGYYAHGVSVAPAVRLPTGWAYASSLPAAQAGGEAVQFAPVSLERLVDSPLYAGANFRRYDLDPGAKVPVWLDVFAERPSQLEARPEQLERHRRLVREAVALFGSRHYAQYDFLLALSDNLTDIGIEHHESSENGVEAGYFSDWDAQAAVRDLLPHEFVHSWNGKFRRPRELWTPSYEVPMHDELLWVYEGLTEYWGVVLAARSGLWSKDFALHRLAEY
ncbi:MAG TPA: hypothetical protein VMT50_00020, partial [Steroidobacteraceae bacterium]|nr:hypothetical protein [Steroidobacteraceae bacterium]